MAQSVDECLPRKLRALYLVSIGRKIFKRGRGGGEKRYGFLDGKPYGKIMRPNADDRE